MGRPDRVTVIEGEPYDLPKLNIYSTRDIGDLMLIWQWRWHCRDRRHARGWGRIEPGRYNRQRRHDWIGRSAGDGWSERYRRRCRLRGQQWFGWSRDVGWSDRLRRCVSLRR